jgi:hypothetical protein
VTSPTWEPDVDAFRFRLACRLAEEGHGRPRLAADVLVDRGRARQDRPAYARALGVTPAQLGVVEDAGSPLPVLLEAVFRRRLAVDVLPTERRWNVMNETLLAEIEARLYGASLADGVASLILTACVAPEELGSPSTRSPSPPYEVSAPSMPPSTYLAKVRVEGFRGIGAPVDVPVRPGPGLTLIVGRNGTGKSSISDALEVLLTGGTARFRLGEKNKAWLDGWRNLHHPDPVRLSADLVVEGQPGCTTVTRHWAHDARLEDATTTVTRPGQADVPFDELAWGEALAAYRPFLSYSELGGLLDVGPSRLYDTLNAILGIADLGAAAVSLRARRLELEGEAKQAASALASLRSSLDGVNDGRAVTVLTAVAGRNRDLAAVAAVVAAPETVDADLDGLRRLAAVAGPDVDAIEAAASRLDAASDAVAAAGASSSGDALRLAALLRSALDVHAHQGDGPCPVCKSGALDAAWRGSAAEEESRLRATAASAVAAQGDLDAAVASARALLRPPPAAFGGPESVVDAWSAWASFSLGRPAELADRLRSVVSFAGDVEAVVGAAAAEVAEREDRWRPYARQVAAWLAAEERAMRNAPEVRLLKGAEKWLKDVEEQIRSERFEPLAKAATAVWEALRMRSSVDVGGIRLAGTANQRRVVVDVSVDGIGGTALGVMSQGELHALALSLFLPRATLDQSPFRFVIVDDPVQAMDPAKVEGLARVLEETARTRQVVVLTHDDRLNEAVRRLAIDATVMEVNRGASSSVVVEAVLDPVQRRLRDARTVAMEKELPADVKGRVVPTLCRQAIEAAAIETVRKRRLGRGDKHAAVEADLAGALKLRQVVALALFDDVGRAGDVVPALNKLGTALQRCDKGAHEGDSGDLEGLITDVRSIVKKILS